MDGDVYLDTFPGFLSAELDPKQAMRASRRAWDEFTVPQGALTWKILDDLELSLNEVRLQRMLAGTFSIYNQAHLEEELEDLKYKCKKGSPLFRAIYSQNFSIDRYEVWMTAVGAEKQNHEVHGVDNVKGGNIALLPLNDLVAQGAITQADADQLNAFRDGKMAKDALNPGGNKNAGRVNMAP